MGSENSQGVAHTLYGIALHLSTLVFTNTRAALDRAGEWRVRLTVSEQLHDRGDEAQPHQITPDRLLVARRHSSVDVGRRREAERDRLAGLRIDDALRQRGGREKERGDAREREAKHGERPWRRRGSGGRR